MENLLRWQPDIILVQEAVTADFIRRDPLLAGRESGYGTTHLIFKVACPLAGWMPHQNQQIFWDYADSRLDPAIQSPVLKVTCSITPN